MSHALFFGTIVEESLTDNRILNAYEKIDVRITNSDDPSSRWHLFTLRVSENDIVKLAHFLKPGPWYMHFWKDQEVVAVFKNRQFRFNHSVPSEWEPVIQYGRALGIPDDQLDFPIPATE